MPPRDLAARLAARKEEIRRFAHAARRDQPQKDAASSRIADRVREMPEYQSAATVLYYVDVRDEVRTRQLIADAIGSSQRTVVPYCVDEGLHLFLLESLDELQAGAYRILEPRAELRARLEKQVAVEQIDLMLVPGLAFDRRGGRLGYGKGYYDRLLAAARRETLVTALAFDCQIFDRVPMQPHDIFMDRIVTETTIHTGRGRHQ